MSATESQLRERIAQLEDKLNFQREILNESIEVLIVDTLRKKFLLTRGECSLLLILYTAYPRPVAVGHINDNLYSRVTNPDDRSDKIVDVYISKIRKKLAAKCDQPIIETLWGGWRVLSKSGFYLINQIVSDVRSVTQKPVFVAREQHR